MRSIRNKLEYIIDNFCDFDCLCFTETHLDDSVENVNISLTTDCYPLSQRQHGGGILVYVNKNLLHKRRLDLKIFWEEAIWIEIVLKFLLGTFYSPKSQDRTFFEALDRNIEKALDSCRNIIILGDLNEDFLNENYRNLHVIVMTNSLQNVKCSNKKQSSFGSNFSS